MLRRIAAALKPGAPFVLTTRNGYRAIRRADRPDADTRLNPLTMVETQTVAAGTASNAPPPAGRTYIVPELLQMHDATGLVVEHVWGGTAGNWGRRAPAWDEIEVMLASRKTR